MNQWSIQKLNETLKYNKDKEDQSIIVMKNDDVDDDEQINKL